MKATELREMSDEQLELTAVEAAETLFRLRLQSQTDRVDIPTQNKKKPTFDCTGQNDPNPAVEGRWWLSFDDCSEVLERSLAKATGSNQQRGTKLDSIGILDRGEKTSTSCRVVTGASGTWHAEFW